MALLTSLFSNTKNGQNFKFRLESENVTYSIPQSVVDGSDTVQFTSSWSKQNVSGSTEPMVAFNYVDNPTVNVNLKFHEDMWREAGLDTSGYQEVISKFAAMIYPGVKGQKITPPYSLVYIDEYVYRGFFTNIRINQYGVIRNGYKTSCEISSTFNIIKRYAPMQTGVGTGFRTYFSD